MDRDTANLEVIRLVERFRAMRREELDDAANLGTIETTIMAKGEPITLSVDVRRRSAGSYRIDVSAFGNNWWRHERVDETVTVDFDDV